MPPQKAVAVRLRDLSKRWRQVSGAVHAVMGAHMAEPSFSSLRRRLINSGVSPRRVGRLLGELRDHHAELVLEEQRAGSRQPFEDALARLGTEESLALHVLARRELLSWSRRWPWAVYGVASVRANALPFHVA